LNPWKKILFFVVVKMLFGVVEMLCGVVEMLFVVVELLLVAVGVKQAQRFAKRMAVELLMW
jgi:hypothetical protein